MQDKSKQQDNTVKSMTDEITNLTVRMIYAFIEVM